MFTLSGGPLREKP